MNKETFLKELSERLQVLNEKERQDVLEEYAQHIDLKIENGQSEEEAVRDFGTPEELCEELLDVYHINAEYASGAMHTQNSPLQNKTEQSQPENENRSGSGITAVLKRIQKGDKSGNTEKKKLSEKIPGFPGRKTEESVSVKSAEELQAEQEEKSRRKEERQKQQQEKKQQKEEQLELKRVKREEWLQKKTEQTEEKKEKREAWMQNKKQQHAEKQEIRKQKQNERKEHMAVIKEERRKKRQEREILRIQKGGSWFGRAIGKTGSFIAAFCLICWKCCLFFAASPFLILALMALFCTGVVAVWLWQGYPLLGITLLGAGGFLAAAGISGLLLSYVFTGKREKKQGDS